MSFKRLQHVLERFIRSSTTATSVRCSVFPVTSDVVLGLGCLVQAACGKVYVPL